MIFCFYFEAFVFVSLNVISFYSVKEKSGRQRHASQKAADVDLKEKIRQVVMCKKDGIPLGDFLAFYQVSVTTGQVWIRLACHPTECGFWKVPIYSKNIICSCAHYPEPIFSV